MRGLTFLTTAAVIAAVAVLAAAQPGPAAVTETIPAEGAVLAAPPEQVVLAFSAPVDTGRSHLSMVDSGGSTMDTGPARAAGDDRLGLSVPASAIGPYAVNYHVTFVDGTELIGTLRFSVGTGGLVSPQETHQHQPDPLSAGLLVLDGLVVVAVLILLARRPRHR